MEKNPFDTIAWPAAAKLTAEGAKQNRKSTLRATIERNTDAMTREGILADVLAVVMVGLAKTTVALAEAKSIDDINKAAEPLHATAKAVLDAIESGALKLPYMLKADGVNGVLADMTKLSNGVSEVLAAAQKT